jgi:hypothetical protein
MDLNGDGLADTLFRDDDDDKLYYVRSEGAAGWGSPTYTGITAESNTLPSA